MKKATPTKGQYIPRTKQSQTDTMRNSNNLKVDLNEMIEKLDGAQLVELGSKVLDTATKALDTATSGMELLKEIEKTSQIRAQISLDMGKVEAGKQAANLDFKMKMAGFDTEDKIDQRRHSERMLELSEFGNKQNAEDGQIMKILELVENGTISAEQLAELIKQTKS